MSWRLVRGVSVDMKCVLFLSQTLGTMARIAEAVKP